MAVGDGGQLRRQQHRRKSKLRAAAATHQLAEAGDEEAAEYYHSTFPTTNRKGIGPGLSFGDPVLNKYAQRAQHRVHLLFTRIDVHACWFVCWFVCLRAYMLYVRI